MINVTTVDLGLDSLHIQFFNNDYVSYRSAFFTNTFFVVSKKQLKNFNLAFRAHIYHQDPDTGEQTPLHFCDWVSSLEVAVNQLENEFQRMKNEKMIRRAFRKEV